MRNKYSFEEKEFFVSLYQKGQTVKQLCEEYHITKSALYNWIEKYGKISKEEKETLTYRQIYLQEKHNNYLQTMDCIHKEMHCSVSSPLKEKLPEIFRLKDKYSIHALCDAFQIRRSTFYHYQKSKPEKKQVEKQDDILRPLVRSVFEKSRNRYGAPKIKVKLAAMGHTVSEKRIGRLMKEMNLVSCYVDKFEHAVRPKAKPHNYEPDKLRQQFKQSDPNKVWVSDFTYKKVGEYVYYICVIIDLFSRKILSYEVSRHKNATFIVSSFAKAFFDRGCPKSLMFHSDQGSQYKAIPFVTMLEQFGVVQSFSRKGVPYDNAVAESFFSCLKREALNPQIILTVEDLRATVEEYVHFYNTERPHYALNNSTPDEVEQSYYSALSL